MKDIKITDLTLKQLRTLKGFTVRDMGAKMGIGFQKYQHKESGKGKFYNPEINKLCEIFNLDISVMNKVINNTKERK